MQLVFEVCSICNNLINKDSSGSAPLYEGDPRITEQSHLVKAWRCTPCLTKLDQSDRLENLTYSRG